MASVTQDRVYAAAEAIEAAGGRASVRTVRDHLGGGSPNQITPLLAAWRAKRPVVAAGEIQLDPRIGQLIAEQVRVAAGEAARRADERASEAEDTLSLCQAECTDLGESLATTVTELETVRAQREQLSGTITELREDLARTRSEALAEIDAAHAKSEREREAAEAARQGLARAELRLEALPRLESDIEQLRSALTEAQAGRVKAEQTAAVGQARLEASERRAESAEGEKGDYKARLETTLTSLEKTGAEAKASTIAAQAAQARLDGLERELASAKADSVDARAELKELRIELREKQKEVGKK